VDDLVIGTVVGKHGEDYRVDIGIMEVNNKKKKKKKIIYINYA
jgi:hypothetical protein